MTARAALEAEVQAVIERMRLAPRQRIANTLLPTLEAWLDCTGETYDSLAATLHRLGLRQASGRPLTAGYARKLISTARASQRHSRKAPAAQPQPNRPNSTRAPPTTAREAHKQPAAKPDFSGIFNDLKD